MSFVIVKCSHFPQVALDMIHDNPFATIIIRVEAFNPPKYIRRHLDVFA